MTKAALNQQSGLPEVLEVVESRFGLKPACPHCAGIRLSRYGSGHTLDFFTGNGQLTKTRLSEALKPVLATDALLVSDGNPTYRAFCRTEGISHEAVNPSQGQRVKWAYHVQNVNAALGHFQQLTVT